MAASGSGHSGQVVGKLKRTRGSQFAINDSIAYAFFNRTDEATGVSQGAHDLVDEGTDGGFAISASNTDQLESLLRVPAFFQGQHTHQWTRISHYHRIDGIALQLLLGDDHRSSGAYGVFYKTMSICLRTLDRYENVSYPQESAVYAYTSYARRHLPTNTQGLAYLEQIFNA
jgi:hypothetical protein